MRQKEMDTQINLVYQGQFGEFTITDKDRQEVILYRTGLAISGLSFALGVALILGIGANTIVYQGLTILFGLFSLGMGLSLWKIHIYLKPLHRALQVFWLIGNIAALLALIYSPEPLGVFVYYHPWSLWGVGFIFAALTGIFFKEAFCFNRLETKFLVPLVPLLLLGHLFSVLPLMAARIMLGIWAGLFLVFVLRKVVQPIPPDIGDKSVFSYLERSQKNQSSTI
jgi:uncharacterized integral membrane protein